MRWPEERDAELRDGLIALLAVAIGTRSERKVPGVVGEFLEELRAVSVSGSGSPVGERSRIDGVSDLAPPDAAGAAVGISGRQVRNLCAAGRVQHSKHGSRYLVDVDDLRRHLRGVGA